MKALILGAGYGVRLYPLTANTPKALLDIAGKPVMEWTLERFLPRRDIDKVFIVTNHRFCEQYQKWLEARMDSGLSLFRKHGRKIVIYDDKSNSLDDKLGAIGDINFVIKKAGIKDDLLIVAGDNLFEINLSDFIGYFKKRGTTICLKDFKGRGKKILSQYGLVALDKDKRVVDFEEKPARPRTSLVAIGLYLFAKNDLKLFKQYMQKGFNPDAPGYYIQWLHKNRDIYGYVLKGNWFDIGDIDSYGRASNYYLKPASKNRLGRRR